MSVCLTAEMSRTRAPRKTGFFAAGRSWPNLNNRKFEVRKALKIVFKKGSKMVELGALHVGKTTRANLSKSNSTCVGARRAGHTFGQICPEIFFSENGQKWCFEWWEGLVKGLWGWESCFWCNLGAILPLFGEVPFGQFRCSWAVKPIMLQFVKCHGNLLVF